MFIKVIKGSEMFFGESRKIQSKKLHAKKFQSKHEINMMLNRV